MNQIRLIFDKLKSLIPDKIYLKLQYWYHFKKILNLRNPKTFNEKIQWLKLYDRKPEYTQFADKYEVRKYIKETIGEEYLIPLIGVYNNVDEINWDSLPDKFVLKCTHGSQCNIICKDKTKLDIEESKKKLRKWINRNWYWYGREWPYKNIKPRIIIEKYLIDKDDKSLTDYKIFCFSGKPLYCQVIRGRGHNETIDFYDKDWNCMPFSGLRSLPKSNREYNKPEKYEEMFKIAGILSDNLPFIRVDLYYVNKQIFFGELTFSPAGGFGRFTPDEWNYRIGNLIKLPER